MLPLYDICSSAGSAIVCPFSTVQLRERTKLSPGSARYVITPSRPGIACRSRLAKHALGRLCFAFSAGPALCAAPALLATHGRRTSLNGDIRAPAVRVVINPLRVRLLHAYATVPDRLTGHLIVLMQSDAANAVIWLYGCPPFPAVVLFQWRAGPEVVSIISAAGADSGWLVPGWRTLRHSITAAVARASTGRIAGVAISLAGRDCKMVSTICVRWSCSFPFEIGCLRRPEMYSDFFDVRRPTKL